MAKYVEPVIGGFRLSDLQPHHIRTVYTGAEEAEQSASSRRQLHAVLHKAFAEAVRQGLLVRNPTDAVEKPTPKKVARDAKEKMRPLDEDAVRALELAAQDDRLGALYVLAVRTGMRQGELFGLRWEDVDLRRKRITVRHSLEEVGGRLRLTTPKSGGGRVADVDKTSVAALREHRRAMLAEGIRAEHVFVDTEGKPLRKSNVQRRSFRPLLDRARLGRVRFHDLRHTHATLLFKAGEHPKVVQERLGHSSIAITLDIYSHAIPSMQQAAAERLHAILDG